MSDPGDRLVYGAGPVRELIARRAKAIKAVWVDPQRAGRSTSDPVAAIVVAAREAGIKLEDRDRHALDRAAGEGALHQGVVAWMGAFSYADLDDVVEGDEAALLVALAASSATIASGVHTTGASSSCHRTYVARIRRSASICR